MYKYIFRTGVHNCVLPRALTCTILYGYFMYLLQIKLHLKKKEWTVEIKCYVYMKLEIARNLSFVRRRALNKTSSSWIKRDQLDVTYFFISLFNAQHVSDVNTSKLRSLLFICWVISWVVLLWFDVCWCYVVVWLGWCGVVSGRRLKQCSLASIRQYLFDVCLLQYIQFWTPDDGRKDLRNM